MAKAEKKARKPREKKDSYLKDNYVPINTTKVGNQTITTRAMHIRGIGVNVETMVTEGGKVISIATNFIAGVKVKTKKDWKYLIIDKGPKKKREKKA